MDGFTQRQSFLLAVLGICGGLFSPELAMIDETIFSIENAVEEIATLRRGEILTINDRRLSAAMLRLEEVLEILRTVEASERVDNPPEPARHYDLTDIVKILTLPTYAGQ